MVDFLGHRSGSAGRTLCMQIRVLRKLHQTLLSSSPQCACFKCVCFDTFFNNRAILVLYGDHMGLAYVNLSKQEPAGLSSVSKED